MRNGILRFMTTNCFKKTINYSKFLRYSNRMKRYHFCYNNEESFDLSFTDFINRTMTSANHTLKLSNERTQS